MKLPMCCRLSYLYQPKFHLTCIYNNNFGPKHCMSLVRNAHKLPTQTPVSKIRNIGIMAHVDAGKTTTTERMLYYSGFMPRMGDVDDGNTVTDYMEQERARGITITSAAVTFNWKNHQLNLIDTPGHIDFTMEVERAICALDGAVTILDASAGVQAQTLTVWHQANRYNVPRIAYLNKMDKPKADVELCVSSIASKLRMRPLLVHQPVFSKGAFTGLIDLVSLEFVTWTSSGHGDGKTFHVQPIVKENFEKIWTVANEKRTQLVENVADLDDELAEIVINQGHSDVNSELLKSALRRVTLQQKGLVTFCGSSFKNVGVQLLMDGIVDYLPSPDEKMCKNLEFFGDDLCALVFKILYDKQKGFLSFLRVYKGSIASGQRIYNMNQDSSENVGKLYIAYADEFLEIPKASNGSIVVVTGLKSAITGDTFVASSKVATAAVRQYHERTGLTEKVPLLGGLNIPEPVFFCSVEPASLHQQKNLEFALECLKREDPSMRVKVDDDVGQTILSGMGELHMEVILDRIKKEFKADAHVGDLQVAYKETMENAVEDSLTLDVTVQDVKSVVNIRMCVRPSTSNSFELVRRTENHEHLAHIKPKYLQAAEHGARMALLGGPVLGFPVINVAVGLLWLEVQPRSSLTVVTGAASQCLTKILTVANCCLLEPYMQLEIATHADHLHNILGDLNKRRGEVAEVTQQHGMKVVNAIVPLAELMSYSTVLRRISSGLASFTMEFKDYRIMSSFHQDQVVKKLTGVIV